MAHGNNGTGKRRILPLKTFHDRIMADIQLALGRTDQCLARRRAGEIARELRRTKCPGRYDEIGACLHLLFDHLGGPKHKRFTTAERAEFYGAFEALKIQDEEAREFAPCAGDDGMTAEELATGQRDSSRKQFVVREAH